MVNNDISVRELIAKNNKRKKGISDKVVPVVLGTIAFISILTTIGIVFTLLSETFTFFSRVSLSQFLLTSEWNPFSSTPKYGIWSLVLGTLKITLIATIVAVPLGLGAAIYLSEYASNRMRAIIKPALEILSGIPTIVFGFFALTFVTPFIREIFPFIGSFNSISPGIIVGIMIIPLISSMSEDAMSSVPHKMREGALGLGATKFEVLAKVILPAATSGIMASIVLAISRAIGETMIVSLAAGSTPSASLDLTSSIQTTFGSDVYYSIYAVGFTLFMFTLIMNLISHWITKRFREEY
jgi:phosphate transport system permease protein